MLRKANDISGFTLGAEDGEIGRVKDFYFDDQTWTVRYVVADTGKWLPLRKVLLSPFAIHGVLENDRKVLVGLTRAQVESSPSIEAHLPISREFEREYLNYYHWPFYWQGPGLWGPSDHPAYRYYPGVAPMDPATAPSKQESDSHLRSISEVRHYKLEATDGQLGHVEDFLIDDGTWAIRYLVVDTRNWWPGKRVLVPTQWISWVSWTDSRVDIDLDRETVKRAPEYNPSVPVTREYEAQLFSHYGREPYWTQPGPTVGAR